MCRVLDPAYLKSFRFTFHILLILRSRRECSVEACIVYSELSN